MDGESPLLETEDAQPLEVLVRLQRSSAVRTHLVLALRTYFTCNNKTVL